MSMQTEVETIKATYGESCSVLGVGTRAVIVEVRLTNQLRVKRYLGKFNGESLQYKSESKMWHAQAPGALCPTWTSGEGSTPANAAANAARRTRALIRDLTRELSILEATSGPTA